jgi:hypothetical protein
MDANGFGHLEGEIDHDFYGSSVPASRRLASPLAGG